MTNFALLERLDELVAGYDERAAGLYRARPTAAAGREYLKQWGVFTRHSRRCWAWVVGNCPEVDVRRFITRENLYDEEGTDEGSHYEKLVRLGQRLGMQRAEIDHAEPRPSTTLALLVWETLTKNRSWQEGLAAKAVLERGGFPEGRRIRQQHWREALGLTDDELDFFAIHITADEIHGAGAFELLARHVGPAEEAAAIAAADASLQAMSLFANGIVDLMVANGAEWPLRAAAAAGR